MKKEDKKGSAGSKIALAVVSVLVLAYVGVALYFTGHFLFGTYVNELPAFNLTAKEIEDEEARELSKYTLTISARGGITETITAEDINLSLNVDDQFTNVLKQQNPFLWPVSLFGETYLTTEDIAVYDRNIVEDRVGKLDIFSSDNVIAPVDAHVSEDVGDDGFYVVPENPGQEPRKETVIQEVCAALDVMESEVLLSDNCYEAPLVFSDDSGLTALCDSLNTYCKAVITYDFGGESVVVDGTRVRDWCDINGTDVTLDEEKVREFVNSLARQYDSFGKDRTIVSHSGEEVTVTGGDYGWWMDRKTETSELIEVIKSGEKTARTPVYFGRAAQYGQNDWGDSYVEIDLTSQHLWVYKDGVVAEESDFVSGCVNKGNMTPVGSYAITYKEKDATLVGENYSSAVKYWMPFNGNVGMHDASWRSEFGGWRYIIDGSHGCINLPTEKAASIYDIVEKGEAVFVYGGKTVPEAVVTQEIVNPETGEVTTRQIPASVAAAEGIPVPAPAQDTGAAEAAPVIEQPVAEASEEQPAPESSTEEKAGESSEG